MAKKTKHKSPEENEKLALEAKALLKSGEVKTIGEAIKKVGINYSAFHKYSKKRKPRPDLKIPDNIEFQEMDMSVLRKSSGKTLIIISDDNSTIESIIGKFIGG